MPSKNKRTGLWAARVMVNGQSAYNGTRHPTRREALAAEEAKRLELAAAAQAKQACPVTVDEFADRWMDDYPRPGASTNNTYRTAARKVGQAFKGVRLGDVDRVMARRWALTAKWVNVRAARTMWADAVNDGLVRDNPFANLRLKQSRGRKDLTVITDSQLEDLARVAVEATDNQEFGPVFSSFILVAAYSCMRPGELAGLCWSDLDFDAGEIDVRNNVEAPSGSMKNPKNGKQRRIILPPVAREALRRVPRVLEPVMVFDVRTGRVEAFDLVFRAKAGGVLSDPKRAYAWAPVRAAFRALHPESRLKDVYELRHKGATMLLERGLSPADVGLQLGHVDGGRLVQVLYGHPSEDDARERLKRAWSVPARLDVVREAKEAESA